MVVLEKNPAGWTPSPSPLGLLSGTGLSGHQGRVARRPPPTSPTQHPVPGARCTQPGLAPQGAPQCLPAEGISTSCRHSTDPGLTVPADFPWREEHDLVREQGPGQQVSPEQPCPALPCPAALPGVPSCHVLWVGVGCPGLGGGWGPGGGATPSPQIPPQPEPLQAVLRRQAFRAPSVLESVRPPPEHSASSGPS